MSETVEPSRPFDQLAPTEISARVDALIEIHSDDLQRYVAAASRGNAWAFFRQPQDMKSDLSDEGLALLKRNEIQIDSDADQLFDYYFNKTRLRINELYDNEAGHKLIHLRNMYENSNIEFSRSANATRITSIRNSGDKQEASIQVPASLEELCILENAMANLTLDTWGELENPDQHWIKIPSLIALSWLQDHFNDLSTAKSTIGGGQYL